MHALAREKITPMEANRCDFRRSDVCSRRFIRCRFRSEPLRNDVAELSQMIFRARHEHEVCDRAEQNPKPRNSERCKTVRHTGDNGQDCRHDRECHRRHDDDAQQSNDSRTIRLRPERPNHIPTVLKAIMSKARKPPSTSKTSANQTVRQAFRVLAT